jgi:hypothetical protein
VLTYDWTKNGGQVRGSTAIEWNEVVIRGFVAQPIRYHTAQRTAPVKRSTLAVPSSQRPLVRFRVVWEPGGGGRSSCDGGDSFPFAVTLLTKR